MTKKISSTLCGVAGEYFVAAELTARGYIASITLRNTKGIDILVSNDSATRQVGIQVKTNQKVKREWLLSKKAEDFYNDDFYYIFVDLNDEGKRPDFFIVPSKVVSQYAKRAYQEWLDTPGRRGQPHKSSSIRKFRDENGEYLERWDLLRLEKSSDVRHSWEETFKAMAEQDNDGLLDPE